jgi:hypothetical protein
MSLITLSTLARKTSQKRLKSNCPYKVEPACSKQSQQSSDSQEMSSDEGHLVNLTVNGKRTKKRLKSLWAIVTLIGLLLFLVSCGSKVVLLKSGEMRVLEDGWYAVSESWVEERLQFENDMVKRLQECHAPK